MEPALAAVTAHKELVQASQPKNSTILPANWATIMPF